MSKRKEKRKADHLGRLFLDGEYQMFTYKKKDEDDEDKEFIHLTYCYCYRDENGKGQTIYSYKLLPDDPAPKGRVDIPCLRELECRLKQPRKINPMIPICEDAKKILFKALRYVKICNNAEYKNNVEKIGRLMNEYNKIAERICKDDLMYGALLAEATLDIRKLINRYTKG